MYHQFGLGSHLTWDEECTIESFGLQNLYGIFTVAHLLKGVVDILYGNVAGPAGITQPTFSDSLWYYVMLGEGKPDDMSDVNPEILRKMRTDFIHWYPVDLRVCGQDLVSNHSNLYLYTNVEIFSEDKWPEVVSFDEQVMLNDEICLRVPVTSLRFVNRCSGTHSIVCGFLLLMLQILWKVPNLL